jgi:hypothetical protein
MGGPTMPVLLNERIGKRICILKMMKQEARLMPVTIAVMKVSGVAAEKIQIDPIKKG